MNDSPKNLRLGALVIVLTTVLAYSPALRAGFLWDDDDHFTQNPHMENAAGLRAMWTTSAARYYPLTLTTFWVERRLWDLAPFPYHLVNVLLHAGNALLLVAVLRRLKIQGAWLAGAIFALHPVNVESVAWITELKNTQSCLFYLLAILSFLKSREKPEDATKWYGVSLLLFAAALLSKPATVMLPVVLVLLLWWIERRVRWQHLLLAVPFALLSAVASVWTIWEQIVRSGARGETWSLAWPERLVIAGKVVWFYLGKLLWPYPLAFIYPRWQIDATRYLSYLPLVGLVVLFAVLWHWRYSWGRPGLMAFGYYVVTLFPVLGFFNIYFFRYSYVGDHFQYHACIGIIALVAALPVWRPGLAGLVLAVLGALTWQQCRIYKDNETLWRDTLAKNPASFMSHCNLALELGGQDKLDEAIAHYTAALQLKPDDEGAHNNIGLLLAKQGKADDAIRHYVAAMRIRPRYADPYCNLANVLARQGHVAEAIEYYEMALRIRPTYDEVHNNLGLALASQGKLDEAIAHFKEALRLRPDYAEAQENLALAMREENKRQSGGGKQREPGL